MKRVPIILFFSFICSIASASTISLNCIGVSLLKEKQIYQLRLLNNANKKFFYASDSINKIEYIVVPKGELVTLIVTDKLKDTNAIVTFERSSKFLSISYERNLKRGTPAPDLFTLSCQ